MLIPFGRFSAVRFEATDRSSTTNGRTYRNYDQQYRVVVSESSEVEGSKSRV